MFILGIPMLSMRLKIETKSSFGSPNLEVELTNRLLIPQASPRLSIGKSNVFLICSDMLKLNALFSIVKFCNCQSYHDLSRRLACSSLNCCFLSMVNLSNIALSSNTSSESFFRMSSSSGLIILVFLTFPLGKHSVAKSLSSKWILILNCGQR